VVSGDIRIIPIFVGVRWYGVVSYDSAVVENATFLLRSLYLPYEVSYWLYISKFTRLRAVMYAIQPILTEMAAEIRQ